MITNFNKSINIYASNQDNKPNCRIVCFPHAGGSASFFRKWNEFFVGAELCAIKYPGRAERINDPLTTNLTTLSYELAQDIMNLTDLPIFLFGHSMGALVAFEVAKVLEKNNVYIECLFASGSKNGNLIESSSEYIEESDQDISNELVKMGGTNVEMVNDPLFKELVLPAIKADSKMFHSYKRNDNSKLNCQIVTIYGKDDVYADIRPWESLTNDSYKEYIVSGGHFYLIDSPPISEITYYLHKHNK